MTAYQGSKGMKRVEGSKADKKADKRHRESSKADKRSDKTILGKHKRSRVTQTPIPGVELAGE
jgi:hypothetical protein